MRVAPTAESMNKATLSIGLGFLICTLVAALSCLVLTAQRWHGWGGWAAGPACPPQGLPTPPWAHSFMVAATRPVQPPQNEVN